MKFFQQSYRQLAKALIGRTFTFKRKEVEILQAQGFPRTENEAPLYAPVIDMKPGEVFCPRHRGGILLLIACLDGNGPGGCILIRKVKIGDETYNGPGRVSEALKIEEHKTTGRISEVRGNLILEID